MSQPGSGKIVGVRNAIEDQKAANLDEVLFELCSQDLRRLPTGKV